MVIKNGIVYKADSLDEVWPKEKKADKLNWQTKKPTGLPGVKN